MSLLPLNSSQVSLPRSSGAPARTRVLRGGAFSSFHMRRLSSPPPSETDAQATTLSGRIKLLIKTYGWYALGVYLVLGVVDFGISFAIINFLGAEQVSRMTVQIKHFVTGLLYSSGTDPDAPANADIDPAVTASATKSGSEGLYAMIVLAYTIHKTLWLPVRVGLTAASTPKIVGWLAKRGWT
ncbi:hypothetical protein FRC03_004963, partial [Tulasnella sp. 419]